MLSVKQKTPSQLLQDYLFSITMFLHNCPTLLSPINNSPYTLLIRLLISAALLPNEYLYINSKIVNQHNISYNLYIKVLILMYLFRMLRLLHFCFNIINYIYFVLQVQIINNTFHAGKPVFKSHHAHWKQQQLQKEREKHLYISFNVKQVIREDDTVEWYGCKRDTARCFGPVIDLMPSYLYEGKWTPPCCLANLRKTALHVFSILDESGVRYWLESGSLLGAMRSGDILKWDYDVDIGFYRDDIPQCSWLQKAKSKPIVDKKGFVWEKATEGNFFRVVYSKSNRIFVNLFPFYNKNGTMAKDSWFTSHKNMEFPEQFLHPMSSIEFLGRYVPSPNNVRDFLEIKFGKGAIENPQYPQPSVLKFP